MKYTEIYKTSFRSYYYIWITFTAIEKTNLPKGNHNGKQK